MYTEHMPCNILPANAFCTFHFFFRILQLLNKRHLEKLKEDWWNSDAYKSKCEKTEDQSDGISIQNIGGVFIVIFVGIGMACITLIFEYWFYKYRKAPKIIDVSEAIPSKSDSSSKLKDTIERHFMKDSLQKSTTLRPRNTNLPSNFRSKY